MADVIILSKTNMHSKACVGGILYNGQSVRLLDRWGNNQPEGTDIEIGQVWKIEYKSERNTRPPHTEDILIQSKELRGTLKEKISDYLINKLKVNVWKGNPDNLFDGLLQWTNNGSGYISEQDELPDNSVGFWISDRDLTKREFHGIRYSYPSTTGYRNIKFVGFQNPVKKIPAGTLIRISLARWWTPDEETEERCYLQLSGWYDYDEPDAPEVEIDDLPF